MSAKDDRPEFCRQRQEDFQEFARARYKRLGIDPPARTPLYPVEKYPAPLPELTGWRVAVHAGNGKVGRVFPRTSRIGPDGTTHGQADRALYTLRNEWEVSCDHECWPRPHPDCGCGVWASETPAWAAVVVRDAVARGWWNQGRPGGGANLIVMPVILHDVVRHTYVAGFPRTRRRELVGGHARIVGPILTTSTSAADDLQVRGFDAQHVADSPEELAEHLEALAVTT